MLFGVKKEYPLHGSEMSGLFLHINLHKSMKSIYNSDRPKHVYTERTEGKCNTDNMERAYQKNNDATE